MEQVETAQRLAGSSFGISGVPLWGKLRASMEQMETVQRLAGSSFGISGVPFWGKLRASSGRRGQSRRKHSPRSAATRSLCTADKSAWPRGTPFMRVMTR